MIKALIYLPNVSRTVYRTRDFERCPEYDNLLAFRGRPLDLEEFNLEAPKLLSQNTITTYGSLPCVKLVDVPLAEPEPVAVEPAPVAPVLDVTEPALPVESVPEVPQPAVLPENVFVEEVEGGVILSDLREGASFLGQGDSGWQSDVALVEPFATAEAATAAFFAQASVSAVVADEVKEIPPTAPKAKSHKKK